MFSTAIEPSPNAVRPAARLAALITGCIADDTEPEAGTEHAVGV